MARSWALTKLGAAGCARGRSLRDVLLRCRGDTPRHSNSAVYDSADEQPAEALPRSPTHLSVSEFGELTLQASSSTSTMPVQDRDSAMGDAAVRLRKQAGLHAWSSAGLRCGGQMQLHAQDCWAQQATIFCPVTRLHCLVTLPQLQTAATSRACLQADLHSRASQPEGDHRDLLREDSASYQRRPPALAERQDSASNLQVGPHEVARLCVCQ